jgi:hypothetical protein
MYILFFQPVLPKFCFGIGFDRVGSREPSLEIYSRLYPFDWKQIPEVVNDKNKVILQACKANLLACVDGGIVDTCWRERAQWTGDLR